MTLLPPAIIFRLVTPEFLFLQTFQEYESMTGHSLEKAIKKEFSGDIMEGLIAIYRCVTNKADYFASRLHKSMAGIGTNDKQLIRVIITRCEVSWKFWKS